jgi:hypothetical protein
MKRPKGALRESRRASGSKRADRQKDKGLPHDQRYAGGPPENESAGVTMAGNYRELAWGRSDLGCFASSTMPESHSWWCFTPPGGFANVRPAHASWASSWLRPLYEP